MYVGGHSIMPSASGGRGGGDASLIRFLSLTSFFPPDYTTLPDSDNSNSPNTITSNEL